MSEFEGANVPPTQLESEDDGDGDPQLKVRANDHKRAKSIRAYRATQNPWQVVCAKRGSKSVISVQLHCLFVALTLDTECGPRNRLQASFSDLFFAPGANSKRLVMNAVERVVNFLNDVALCLHQTQ